MNFLLMEMLNTLETLANKLSPVTRIVSSHHNVNNNNSSNNNNNNSILNNNNNPQTLDNNGNKIIHDQYSKQSVKHLGHIDKDVTTLNNNNAHTVNQNQINNNNMLIRDNNNIKSIDDSEENKDQPDPDYIKMFVGQVPRTMDEAQLKEMFEEFGRVHQINVLRDKSTGLSKGCCFVTFYTRKAALKAQDALHNIKTLVGMHHPIQMKPADSENRNERKLFVGMLNKKYNENDVRQLFNGHGTIEECTVLRDPNGQSKGCAFVTFSTKQAAIAAIKTLHQSQTMEGCSAPIVVKFADTQKEKDAKRIHQLQSNLWNLASGINSPVAQSPVTVASPIQSHSPAHTNSFLTTDALSPASLQILQQIQAFGLQQQLLHGLSVQSDASVANSQSASLTAAAAAGMLGPMSVQNLLTLAAMTQPSLSTTSQSPNPLHNTATPILLTGHTADSLAAQFSSPTNPSAALQMGSYSTNPLASTSLAQAVASAAGKQIEGPEGCNLFIYHLPQEFTDTDLASTFLPFGNVISAKVFVDKQTNLSKCFGFVSFDNVNSAQAAIQSMHGFQIGTKRLKVQLKRSKDASKPY